jgi:gamma-glutamyl-gamma-aminobutyraldehyde dehydrogenase
VTAPSIFDALKSLSLPGRAVIDGALVEAASGQTFHNVSPRDGTVINQVAACQAVDVDRAGWPN